MMWRLTTLLVSLASIESAVPRSPVNVCVTGHTRPDTSSRHCGHYQLCVHGVYLRRACAPALHYDTRLGLCNWPHLAKCHRLDASRYASCKTGDRKPNPGDCRSYNECVFGVYIVRPCPANLHFDPVLGFCNWPHLVNCATSSSTTTSAPATTTKTATTSTAGWSTTWTRLTSTTSTVVPPGGTIGNRVVCYYTNWSWNRKGRGQFSPEDIATGLCTHIIFAFTMLDENWLTVQIQNPAIDIEKELFERVLKQKISGTKVLFAIGGWNDSAGSKYSKMVASKESRARFIRSAVAFLERWGFDGIDLDWEYPGCPQGACSHTYAEDKDNFARLVRELRETVGNKYLITAAVSAAREKIDKGYNVPRLAKDLDFINVMTYDFFGAWNRKAGHNSPFKRSHRSGHAELNVVTAMELWVQAGAPANKLVMGVAMYGRGVTLDDARNHRLGAPGGQPSLPGPYTQEPGYLSFYEVCQKVIQDGYQIVKDPNGNVGPYIHKDRQWISYDDWDIVFEKLEYAMSKGFGGAMIWSMDLDDFSGEFCRCGKYPLLSLISAMIKGQTPKKPDCPIFQ